MENTSDPLVTRVLSCHAPYRCQRRGACCTAGWPIPVEADRLGQLRAALATGGLRPAVATAAALVYADDAPAETPALVGVDGHRCVFFDRAGTRGCRIHESLGHAALPLACRQFPRASVIDPRGAAVTLSAYCPTAAALLDTADPITILINAPHFPSGAEYVGLDASAALPPLLCPNVLMDWESWWRLESRAVDWLANGAGTLTRALLGLRRATEDIVHWVPGSEPLDARIDAAFDALPGAIDLDAGSIAAPQAASLVVDVLDAIPGGLEVPRPGHAIAAIDRVATRYLAAHAFANWTAHLGTGVQAWVRSICAAAALLAEGYDVGQADLMLRHLADPQALAARWSAADAAPRRARPTPRP